MSPSTSSVLTLPFPFFCCCCHCCSSLVFKTSLRWQRPVKLMQPWVAAASRFILLLSEWTRVMRVTTLRESYSGAVRDEQISISPWLTADLRVVLTHQAFQRNAFIYIFFPFFLICLLLIFSFFSLFLCLPSPCGSSFVILGNALGSTLVLSHLSCAGKTGDGPVC